MWSKPFDVLRQKWVEVPIGGKRLRTDDLLGLSDHELLEMWSEARRSMTEGQEFNHRGWYHSLYKYVFKGKKVMDIGSGFGIDGLTFAQQGAHVTYVDICESNLEVLKRLSRLLQLGHVDFRYLDRLASLETLDRDYDVLYAQGSLHHAPVDVIGPEVQALLDHLQVGGRWIQLAYPKSRWVREGSLSFSEWGKRSDGENTPWAEWYDWPKLQSLLLPAEFDVVLCQEFHNNDFIWFDLIRRK